MSCHQRRGNVEVLAALAAITGQSDTDMAEEYHEATREYRDMHYASSDEVEQVLRRIKTRLGLAPAVDPDQARDLAATLDALLGDPEVTITRSHLFAWDCCGIHLSMFRPSTAYQWCCRSFPPTRPRCGKPSSVWSPSVIHGCSSVAR
ncbi:hypothetical protein GCM10009583_08540 [Ornithinicoccus hortensis]